MAANNNRQHSIIEIIFLYLFRLDLIYTHVTNMVKTDCRSLISQETDVIQKITSWAHDQTNTRLSNGNSLQTLPKCTQIPKCINICQQVSDIYHYTYHGHQADRRDYIV